MKKNRDVSLRVYLTTLIGVLVCVSLAYAVGDLRRNWELARRVAELVNRNRVADDCLQAVANFAFERGRSHVVLHGPGPVEPENRRFIDTHRQAADHHLAQVLSAVPADARQHGEQLAQAWVAVRALRSTVDDQLAKPRSRRDHAFPAQWLRNSDHLIEQLESLLVVLSGDTQGLDATFHGLAGMRIQALRLRILVGRHAMRVGALVAAGAPPGEEMLMAIHELRGQVNRIWASLETEVARLDEDASLLPAMQKTRHAVFDNLRPVQDEIVRAIEDGRLPPLSVEQFLSVSAAALNATAALADTINRRADTHAEQLLERAGWRMALSAGGIAAVLALCGVALWIFSSRFTRPLNDVLQRIDRLLRAQSGGERVAALCEHQDEIGKIAQALSLLDEAIGARALSEAALRESESMSASVLACVPQAIICTDLSGVITVFSPGAEQMLGYTAAEMVGRQTPALFHDVAELRRREAALARESGRAVTLGFDVFAARIALGSGSDGEEWTYVRKDGSSLTVMLTTTLLRDASGKTRGYLGVATDVTERTAQAARISQMAYHDELTQLPNGRLFSDRLQMALIQARRDDHRLAVMLVDLDRFKPVNDRFGHRVGDLLLREVAARMRACLRESDTLARVGGDEFCVLLPGVALDADAVSVAGKMCERLRIPFELEDDVVVTIGCSVGVAMFPEHGESEETLRRCADEAMYLSKERGRNCVTLFGGMPRKQLEFFAGEEPPVLRLAWHRSFQSGIPGIDREHRKLIEHANRIISAMVRGRIGKDRLLLLLGRLVAEVKAHFAHEERVLEYYGFPHLAEHAVEHRRLMAQLKALRRRTLAAEASVGDLVGFVAQDVVAGHILKEDVAFFAYVRRVMRARGEQTDG